MVEIHEQLIVLSLTYGMAFYAVAIVIVLEWRRDSPLPFTRALPSLAVFGFLLGVVETIDVLMFVHIDLGASIAWLATLRAALVGSAYLFLLWFGVSLVTRGTSRRRWMRLIAPALFLLWVVVSLEILELEQLPISSWPFFADGLARVLLAVPGGLLAVWGLHRHKSAFDELRMPQAGRDCIWAGILFAIYSAITCTVAIPRLSLRAYAPSHDLFMATQRLPTEAVQTVLALSVSFFILRIMRAYQQELRYRIAAAEDEKYRAQLKALEARERAEEQLRRWNDTLEQRVVNRTSELVRRQEEAEALYEISTEISALVELDTILTSVVDKARYLLGSDVATLTMVEDGQRGIQVRTRTGAIGESLIPVTIDSGVGLVGKVIATGHPFRTDDYLSDDSIKHTTDIDARVMLERLKAHMAVPVTAGDQVVGALLVASRGSRLYNEADEWLLSRIAILTGLAIQNSRLHARAQQTAILEERERLSREIHDGLSQTLGFIGMVCGAARNRLELGQLTRVQGDLEELEHMARSAYQDAREAIMALRVSTYGGRSMVTSLREYLDRFREQSKVETSLKIHPDWPESVDPASEVQLMRIVQEALSNVRKHAGATAVSVELSARDDWAEIAVTDDGKGFDAQAMETALRSRFGMQTMRERARSIGGDLGIESRRGRGTRVLIRIPKGSTPIRGSVTLGTVA